MFHRSRGRALLALAALAATLLGLAPAKAANTGFCNIKLTTTPNCYITMPDGTSIAAAVFVPPSCSATSQCPTIFEMAGYENGSAELNPDATTSGELQNPSNPGSAQLGTGSGQLTQIFYNHGYAVVQASVRGTGCSSGEFDLFSNVSAQDGKYIIDNWIAAQSWSNGDVGIMGHSYSGLTGTMIAETQPRHLRAITTSGLIDDLYRGITYLGGVSNMGFPPLWTLGVREAYDIVGGSGQGILRPIYRNFYNPYGRTFDPAQAQICAQNTATHSRTVLNDPVVQGAIADTDNGWWQSKSLIYHIQDLRVPTWMSGAYQDEQTGPRGFAKLWESVPNYLPKRLLISNGSHGTNQDDFNMNDRLAWMDLWMKGIPNADINEWHTVRVFQELVNGQAGSEIKDDQFPLSGTQWTDYYMHGNGSLSTTPTGSNEPPMSYVSGTQRQSWFWETGPTAGAPITTHDGPDEATFTSAPLAGNMSIAGPITAHVNLSSLATDTELFVQLIDVAPNGTRLYLQRGLLKASHQAVDLSRSDCVYVANNERTHCTDDGTTLRNGVHLYRPFNPHTNPQNIVPGQTYDYLVEIFPLGHVFRTGHQIMVKIMAPPHFDSYYAYILKSPLTQNTIVFDPAHPTKITLPVIPDAPVNPVAPAQCSMENIRCITAPNG